MGLWRFPWWTCSASKSFAVVAGLLQLVIIVDSGQTQAKLAATSCASGRKATCTVTALRLKEADIIAKMYAL